jgi:carbamoyltransferase
MLLNTSFNCQEPIVETPEQALATFENSDLDLLVLNNHIVRKNYD